LEQANDSDGRINPINLERQTCRSGCTWKGILRI